MNSQAQMEIVLKAVSDVQDAVKGLQQIGSEADKTTSSSGKLAKGWKDLEGTSRGLAIGLAGIGAGLVAFGVSSVKAFMESEVEMAKFNQTMKNAGDISGQVAKQFEAQSQATIQMGFDDEESANSLAKLYSITKDQSQATKDNALAMDLARAKGIDLSSATDLLAKVYAGSGARALKEFGIEVDANATSMEIMATLQGKVGGQAKAFTETYAGQMEVLKNTFGNLQEEVGAKLIPVLNSFLQTITPLLIKFADWVSDSDRVVATLKEWSPLLAGVGTAILGFLLPALISVIASTWAWTVALLANPITWIILGISAFVASIVWLVMNWETAKEKILEVWQKIKEGLQAVWDGIKTAIMTFINWYIGIYVGAFTYVKDAIVEIWNAIKEKISGIIDGIMDKVKAMVDAVVNAWNTAKSYVGGVVSSAWTSTKEFFTGGGKANGGDVYGARSYLVGENGPEIFTPNATGRVIPNSGFGGNITLNFNGDFLGDEQIAKKISGQIVNDLQFQMKI